MPIVRKESASLNYSGNLFCKFPPRKKQKTTTSYCKLSDSIFTG